MVLRVLSGSLWGEGVRGARTSQDNEIDKEAIDVWAEIIYHITFFSLEQEVCWTERPVLTLLWFLLSLRSLGLSMVRTAK